MRILGIDYGSANTGIAISDPSGQIAFPREIIKKKSKEEIIQTIQSLIEVESIEKIIIGLPISLAGNSTLQTSETQRFIDELNQKVTIPIETMDERLTSVQAERLGGLDDVAAQIILQTYLDRENKRVE